MAKYTMKAASSSPASQAPQRRKRGTSISTAAKVSATPAISAVASPRFCGTIDCAYAPLTAGRQVRMVLMSRLDLERMRADEPHGFLAATEAHARGTLSFRIAERGEYVVLIRNDDDTPARVRLRIDEDFAAGRE